MTNFLGKLCFILLGIITGIVATYIFLNDAVVHSALRYYILFITICALGYGAIYSSLDETKEKVFGFIIGLLFIKFIAFLASYTITFVIWIVRGVIKLIF